MTLCRKSQKRRLIDHQGGGCAYCNRVLQVEFETEPDYGTWDEIIPQAHGGRRIYGNVVIACRACNSMKRDKLKPLRAGLTVYIPPPDPGLARQRALDRERFEMEWEELPDYDER